MKRVLIGVDPGLSGAVAAIGEGRLIAVIDMPVVGHGRAGRRVVNAVALALWLRALQDAWPEAHLHAVVEEPGSRHGQGITSTGAFMRAAGRLEGVLGALGIATEYVAPSRWKRDLGLQGADKDASRGKAVGLFPGAELHRKKDHGRAEALLLAWWGLQRLAPATERSEHVA